MNKNTAQPRRMTRRDFLKLLAAGSAAAVGGYVLYEFAPWLDYEGQSEHVWTLKENDPMRHLVHYATLAANGHNTQPWKFPFRETPLKFIPITVAN